MDYLIESFYWIVESDKVKSMVIIAVLFFVAGYIVGVGRGMYKGIRVTMGGD